MHKRWLLLVWVAVAIFAIQGFRAAGAAGRSGTKQATPTLKVGDAAPDFALLAFDGTDIKKVSLSDYRGKKSVALAFYVFAFTGG